MNETRCSICSDSEMSAVILFLNNNEKKSLIHLYLLALIFTGLLSCIKWDFSFSKK